MSVLARQLGPFACAVMLGSCPVAADEHMQAELQLFNSGFDAGGNDDFERGRAISAHYNYAVHRWLALDVGVYVSENVRDKTRTDIVGTYQVNLDTYTLLLGLKPRYRFTEWQVYGRLGMLRYETELEVEEYFNEEIPGGTDSATDQGLGYYVGIGAEIFVTERVSIQFEYNRMTQLDLFEGRTGSPFDLTTNSIGIGCGFTF